MLQETTQCHLAASINLLSLRPEHVLGSNEIGNLACSETGPFLTPGWASVSIVGRFGNHISTLREGSVQKISQVLRIPGHSAEKANFC